MSKLFRDLNPFEGEARARVNRELGELGLVEPNYHFGQFELKATVPTFRDLRNLADQYGGVIEVDHEAGRYYSRDSKVFTVIEVQGVKVYVCAYASEDEAEEYGL